MHTRVRYGALIGLIVVGLAGSSLPDATSMPQAPADASSPVGTAKRLPGNPIVTPESDPSLGKNINGPSLIRVPAWVVKPRSRSSPTISPRRKWSWTTHTGRSGCSITA
jgi:hypothetical protein